MKKELDFQGDEEINVEEINRAKNGRLQDAEDTLRNVKFEHDFEMMY